MKASMKASMRPSKLLLFATGLVVCVSTQSTRPALADNATAPRPASYAQSDAISSPSGAMAKTCYPVWGQCTKDTDCCTGFCRVGKIYAYCDYK
jgi:hypothetical protein